MAKAATGFDFLDKVPDFDVDKLVSKEIIVEFQPNFRSRNNKNGAVIEVDVTLAWVSDEADKKFLGQEFKHPIFLDPDKPMNIKALRDLCKSSGANTDGVWGTEGGPRYSIMLPGFVKLLAWQRQSVYCTVRKADSRNFLTLKEIARAHPETGAAIEGALEKPIPDDLILEAVDQKLKGEEGDNLPF